MPAPRPRTPASSRSSGPAAATEMQATTAPVSCSPAPPGRQREYLPQRGRSPGTGKSRFILPAPWHRGRVLLIGDAAHACTPHLAYGAGIAVEDGVVLGQVLATYDDLPAALEAFMHRRYERCRMVVNNSLRLGEWEQDAVPETSRLSAELTEQSWAALAEPI